MDTMITMYETIEMRWVNRISFHGGDRISTPTLQYRERQTNHGIDTSVKCTPFTFDTWSNWIDVPVTNEEIY